MGSEATFAATRLLLVDPRGEIDPEALLELLEAIESKIWEWINKDKGSQNQVDVARNKSKELFTSYRARS